MRCALALIAWSTLTVAALAQAVPSAALPPYPFPTPNVLTSKNFTTGNTTGGGSITYAQLGYSEAPYAAVRACWENTLAAAETIDGVMFAPSAAPNDNYNPVNAAGTVTTSTAFVAAAAGSLPIAIPAAPAGGLSGPTIVCSAWTAVASIPRTDIPGAPPLVMVRAHASTPISAGSPTPASMAYYSGQPIVITAGSYNSTTGLVSLTIPSGVFPTSDGFTVGHPVTIAGATGTGTFASINGSFIAAAGTAGTTLTYTVATGQTMTITGANVVNPGAAPNVRPVNGYYKSQSLATFQTPSNLTAPTNAYISMSLQFQTAVRGSTIMAIGDSITQGVASAGLYNPWGQLAATMASSLQRPVQFLNCGVQGNTTANFQARCVPYLTAFSPQVVFISPYSPNDPSTSAQATLDYTQAMALAAPIKASGMQPIFWTAIPYALSAGTDSYRLSLNAQIRAQTLYPVADMDAVVTNGATPARMSTVCQSGDNTHPTPYCEGLMANVALTTAAPYLP